MMTSPMLNLLAHIASGISIFEPFGRTELLGFQDTVHRLQEMERQGLISRVFTQPRMIISQEYCDLVMVQGGFTAEGERLLAEHQSVSAN